MGGGASSGLGGTSTALSEAERAGLVQVLERAVHHKLEVAMHSSKVDAASTEGSADVPKVVAEHKGGDEVALPQDHEDQIQLGFRIIQSDHQDKDQIQLGIRMVQVAHHNMVASLEKEIRGLRLTCEEQRANVAAVQKKQSSLEVELVENHQRSQHLAEENRKMTPRVDVATTLRTALSELDGVVCELQSRIGQAIQSEDVSKLLHAKTTLSSGLENSSTMQSQDIKEEEEEDVNAVPLAVRKLDGELVTTVSWGQKLALARLKYIVAEKVGVLSSQVKLLWNGPEGQELTTNEDLFGAHTNLKNMCEQADAQATSTLVTAELTLIVVQKKTAIDGKAFFRKARGKLSHENFNQFLSSIKRLNNQQQTREETLEESRRVFGEDNSDLFADFEELLNQQGMQ